MEECKKEGKKMCKGMRRICKSAVKEGIKRKICAVITVVCFMVTTVGANVYATPVSVDEKGRYEKIFNKASGKDLGYGKVTAKRDAKSEITVVNIQDLHCHAQTQRNISKIIGELVGTGKVKRVYVEGGYGDIDTGWVERIKGEEGRREAIEELLEGGVLTGSEYYKMTNEGSVIELKGLEEEGIHRENIKRLGWIINNQGKYKEVTRKIDREIKLLCMRYINARNKRFNDKIEEYISGKIDTKKFYRQLMRYVGEINKNSWKYNNITAIKMEDYPNIAKYMMLMNKNKGMDMEEITFQMGQVIGEIKAQVPYKVYKRLMKETDNMREGNRMAELVLSLCEERGIDLGGRYGGVKGFLEANRIRGEINPIKLVFEERELIGAIREALSYDREEYEITYIKDFERYFKDYLGYKLTEADWEYFKRGYKKFEELYAKYAVVNRIKEIEGDFEELNEYYGINERRNNIFVEKMLTKEKIEEAGKAKQVGAREGMEIIKGSKEVIVAVTGGFHSGALEEILAGKGVNVVVITPDIVGDIGKSVKRYKGIIEWQSRKMEGEALAYTVMSSMGDSEKKKVALSVIKGIMSDEGEDFFKKIGYKEEEKGLMGAKEAEGEGEEWVKRLKEAIEVALSEIEVVERKHGYLLKQFSGEMVDKMMLKVATILVEEGIYFSNGATYEIEESSYSGKKLVGIEPEIYSRFKGDWRIQVANATEEKKTSFGVK